MAGGGSMITLCANCRSGREGATGYYCASPHRNRLIIQYSGKQVAVCSEFKTIHFHGKLRAASWGFASVGVPS